MAQIELHPDFKDFLRLLNSLGVKYLVLADMLWVIMAIRGPLVICRIPGTQC